MSTLFEYALNLQQFDGATYNDSRDSLRLNKMLTAVQAYMGDGEWHTLPEIAEACSASQTGISARLRDLRKVRFGAHTVESKNVGDGCWKYRLVL